MKGWIENNVSSNFFCLSTNLFLIAVAFNTVSVETILTLAAFQELHLMYKAWKKCALNLFMCLNCEIKDLDLQYVFNCPLV
jgi:hypothetical protein